jgi:hypothetical protein
MMGSGALGPATPAGTLVCTFLGVELANHRRAARFGRWGYGAMSRASVSGPHAVSALGARKV